MSNKEFKVGCKVKCIDANLRKHLKKESIDKKLEDISKLEKELYSLDES